MSSYVSYSIAVLAAITIAFFIFIIIRKKWYVNVPKGSVMIINKLGSSLSVSFTGALIYPVIYPQETMKTPLITIAVSSIDQTPKDKLGPSNILDVQGIEKINILLS